MEHISVTEMANGSLLLIPEEGYALVYLPTGMQAPEANIKKQNLHNYSTIKLED